MLPHETRPRLAACFFRRPFHPSNGLDLTRRLEPLRNPFLEYGFDRQAIIADPAKPSHQPFFSRVSTRFLLELRDPTNEPNRGYLSIKVGCLTGVGGKRNDRNETPSPTEQTRPIELVQNSRGRSGFLTETVRWFRLLSCVCAWAASALAAWCLVLGANMDSAVTRGSRNRAGGLSLEESERPGRENFSNFPLSCRPTRYGHCTSPTVPLSHSGWTDAQPWNPTSPLAQRPTASNSPSSLEPPVRSLPAPGQAPTDASLHLALPFLLRQSTPSPFLKTTPLVDLPMAGWS